MYKIKRRGFTLHKIPYSRWPHRCHPFCYCNPTKVLLHGRLVMYIHNAEY